MRLAQASYPLGSSRDLIVQKCNRKSFLSINGVAVSDTCKLLIEYGFVRVNGVVAEDPCGRIRSTDHAAVKGRAIGDEESDDDSVLAGS